jgi:hypothetical protein
VAQSVLVSRQLVSRITLYPSHRCCSSEKKVIKTTSTPTLYIAIKADTTTEKAPCLFLAESPDRRYVAGQGAGLI